MAANHETDHGIFGGFIASTESAVKNQLKARLKEISGIFFRLLYSVFALHFPNLM
jgi:hypothetical protein